MFQIWSCNDPTLPAVWIEKKQITYEQLFYRIKELSFFFLQQGIRAGDRVAFLAETSLNSIVTFFALLEIKASPCLLSTKLPEKQIPSHLKSAQISFFLNLKTYTAQKCDTKVEVKKQAILLFTSGSSGSPKLASFKIEHFLASAHGSSDKMALGPGKNYLLSVPLFHVSGLSILFRCFLTGSSLIFTQNLLDGHPFVSHISLVPTQLLRVIEKGSFFPKLECALIGGAQISENLVQMALQKEIPLFLTYGMTEMASQITMTCLGDTLLPVHLGKPLPGKEVTIANDGEILVKGSSLFSGYDSPLGVQKNLLEGGWFPTGDLGAWNQNFDLEYKGRKDNLFISGGENIYPEMIEKALGSIDGVLQSLVIPIDDLEFGQRPVAFVHMQNNMPSKEEFHEKLSCIIPRFCLPIHFLPFPQEIQEGNFKIKRADLKSWLQKTALK